MQRVLEVADVDDSGELDFDEFRKAMVHATQSWAGVIRRFGPRQPPSVVRWNPFPSEHAKDRALDDFEPTRIGSIRMDDFTVDG